MKEIQKTLALNYREARITIETLEVISNDGFSVRDLSRIIEKVKDNQESLMEVWNEIRKDQ